MESLDKELLLEVGAYISDGTNLFEVIGTTSNPGPMGIKTARIALEHCTDFSVREFFPERIKEASQSYSFMLVRPAPMPYCPDFPERIAWDSVN